MLALLTAAAGDIRATFGLLVITMIIDGTDGILARRVRVRDVLPKFDGASLDNVIDVLTYGYIPIFIMATQNLLPHPGRWCRCRLALCLWQLMKTPDSFSSFSSYGTSSRFICFGYGLSRWSRSRWWSSHPF